MNDLQYKSLEKNLNNFLKNLTDTQMVELTNFLLYDCYEKEPNKWIAEFIDDFFEREEWDKNLSDEIKKPEYFFSASRNTQELIRIVRIAVLEKSFNKIATLLEKEPKVKLTKKDKNTLSEILTEHQSMLEYQLEDEDEIRKHFDEDEGTMLIANKRKHLKFLETFGNLKFI